MKDAVVSNHHPNVTVNNPIHGLPENLHDPYAPEVAVTLLEEYDLLSGALLWEDAVPEGRLDQLITGTSALCPGTSLLLLRPVTPVGVPTASYMAIPTGTVVRTMQPIILHPPRGQTCKWGTSLSTPERSLLGWGGDSCVQHIPFCIHPGDGDTGGG